MGCVEAVGGLGVRLKIGKLLWRERQMGSGLASSLCVLCFHLLEGMRERMVLF